ncbi:MFS transporter [uncultured Clostridium sp.]|uniref:MFS transporter n=1 Tax=uncultured Clostridium sp. TaxID=59620 RepID=UPI0025EFB845|nr:MFS transporter [uncultured Clostridium sp.]
MATILLIIIYIAFIGLGIPDSLFGTAWPAIYREFDLPISAANYVNLLTTTGTVISSLFSARVINKFGTGKVTAVSTSLTAVALLGFSCSSSIWWLCLLAIPLGIGGGAIDAALNNYVALYYKASHMSFLHCFYGIGVSLSPYLMSIALSNKADWRMGYRTTFYFQIVISIITICALPIWGKIKNKETVEEEKPRTVSISEMIKMPSIRAVGLMFIGSCAVEYICGAWGSTFLVNSRGMVVENAAKAITFYYMGMAVGRFLSGILSSKLSSWNIIKLGQAIVFVAILSLVFSLPSKYAVIGLFMIGIGNGPVFPNLIHLTPKNFGKDISQSVIGLQMASAYIGIMAMPPIFGFLAQNISVNIFPYFILIMFMIMIIGEILLTRNLKRNNKY